MSAKRLYKPSILLNAVEYQCKIRSVSLEPGEHINYCEQEWTFSAEIELGYGAAESWTLLNALRDTIVPVVLKPEDAVVGATNPSATFQIRMPAVPFITSAPKNDRMTFTLESTTEAEPVFAVI